MADALKGDGGFASLPDEICSLIFSYFHPLDDDLLKLASVSRRWRDIIYNTPLLWKTLESTNFFSAKRLSTSLYTDPEEERFAFEYDTAVRIVKILCRFGRFILKLKTKNIREENLRKASIFSALEQLKSLKSINVDLPCEDKLFASLSGSTSLEEFSVRGVQYTPQERQITRISEEVVLKFADHFPNLTKVELCDCFLTYNTVAPTLAKLKQLNEIKIKFRLEGGFNIPGVDSAFIKNYRRVDVGRFLTSLAQSEFAKKVTVISLEDVFINGDDVKKFMKLFTSLRKFKLTTYIVDTDELEAVDIESSSLEELKIWDIANIKSVSMVLPKVKKLFISDLHLDSLHITAPSLENLVLGPLRSFDEHLDILSLEMGNLVTLEVTDVGPRNSINVDTLLLLLRKNQNIKHLNVGAYFTSTLSLTNELCPCLDILCVNGSVHNINTSCAKLQRLDISAECIDPDCTSKQAVYLSANECDVVVICQVPNLGAVFLDCPKLNLVFINDCLCPFSKAAPVTTVFLSKGTAIQTLSIDNLCSVKFLTMGENRIGRLKIKNCLLEDPFPVNIKVKSIEISKCEGKTLDLTSDTLEEIAISGCTSLRKISLHCPSLWRLKIGDNKVLFEEEGEFYDMLDEIKQNCPNVEIVLQNISD